MSTSTTPLSLSVLDQSPVPEGSSPGEALRNTIDLARRADELGYVRYWLAEHHGTPALACASPEVLIGPVAAATSRMRIGSGGVMLPHYSPLKVAESFRMLSELYPDRIDLGIGRAAGTSPNIAHALQRDRRHPAPDDFPEQLDELLRYLVPDRPAAGPLRTLTPAPADLAESRFEVPEPWLLGSSPQSAVWAAELGLSYVFADFINPGGEVIAGDYCSRFVPSKYLASPRVAVAAWVICAESDAEALHLSASARMMMLQLYRGRLIPVPPVERALQFLANEGIPLELLPVGRRLICGSPAKVRTQVEALARGYRAQEVLLVNILYDHAARVRSYGLVAEAFELAAAPDLLQQVG